MIATGRVLAPASVAALCALAACEARYPEGKEPKLTAEVVDPTIEAGSHLPVRIQVENFDLQPPGKDLPFVLGQGHLHIYLDTADEGCGSCLLKMTVVDGQQVLIPLQTEAGPHKLIVQLEHNDHTKVDGVDPQTFDITVTDPELVFVVQRVLGQPFRPGEGASAELTVGGFALDVDRFESEDVLRHGHYHVFFEQDGSDPVDLGPFFDGKPQFTIPEDAEPGEARLLFALHSNVHEDVEGADPVSVDVEIEAAP